MQSRAALGVNLVALYKALGGGWEGNDPVSLIESRHPLKPFQIHSCLAQEGPDEAVKVIFVEYLTKPPPPDSARD